MSSRVCFYEGDKNMKVKFFAAIMAMSICLAACGPKESTPQEQTSEESMPEELTSEELTSEELENYSAYLRGWDCYGFLLSSYDDVREADLGEVFYSGAGLAERPGEEEVEAYLQAAGQEEVYTDLICIPATKMDELLIEKTGYSLQEMKDAGNDLQTVYLKEYDAYFGEAGDTNYLSVTCTSGTENADGTVTLECESGMEDGDDYTIVHRCTVTLDRDTRRFISNVITDGYKVD